ncbi:MAG: hypothetical protein M3R27_04855 [Bacteroidota bacterium]|nr:hypothetical protein [Bacteroidota bacterium]
MIDPEYYDLLTLDDKVNILYMEGDFIAGVELDSLEISLYALDGFFVEVFYELPYNKIDDIRVLSDKDRLEVYLENITLEKLLK